MHITTERALIMGLQDIATATANSDIYNEEFHKQSIAFLIEDGFTQKQAEAIYSFGYSHGHASGNSEIAGWMEAAVELAKSLLES